ncbi:hypothetical protein HJC23_012770 [Cyclotella cryptica]|uniref:RanBP2-type domain-containing protein n=1 Tax=Cyclotella cryptica TaxID=29204 RepID=A0ABD3Q9E1_9STRA
MEDRIPINSESPSLTLDELQHSDELPENPQISIEGDSSVQASHGGTENSALEESKDGDVDMAYAMGEAETGAPDERNHSNAQVLHLDKKDTPPTPPASSFKEIPSTLDEPSLDNVAAAPRDDQVLKSNSPNATKDEDLSEDQKIFSRRSKRPRTSITFTRYSPGEGGGLKRHKAEKDAGGQQHKLLSPVSTESQIIIKSNSTSVEKNNNEVSKKKDLVLKNRSTHHGEKSDNVTRKHDTSKQPWSGPIYSWVEDGIKTANPLPQPVEPVSSDSNCIIIDHTALSIDFGPGLAGEDNGPTSPLAAESPSWKCVKCFNMNVSSKSRCSFCLSWKGGKRDKYPRRSSVDSTASNSGCGPPQPLVIRVGDDVLISRGDAPWKDFNHLVNRSLTLERNSEYASMCYDDPVSRDPGFGVLDPYVARIERMWEEIDDTAESCEGAKKKNGSSVNSSASLPRMMIQTRWYFKREDLEGLSCKLVLDGQTDGVKQRIVSSMTVRDLILSDQVDSNYVTSILGKSNILTLNPSSKGKEKRKLPRGAFVCRYRLDLNTDGSTTGTIRPILDSAAGEQTMQMSTPSNSVQSKDTNRREVEGTSSEDEGSYPPATKVFSSSAYVGPISPTRRVISEGATTMGKIKVGSDYQAFIPDRVSSNVKSSISSFGSAD